MVMQRFIISIITTIVFAAAAFAQSNDSDEACKALDKKVTALIIEYKELRERRRQLQQGSYDSDLSGSGGRLQEVLSSLGAKLGRPPYTKKTITNCVGAPDAVRSHQEMRGFLEIYNKESKRRGQKLKGESKREYLIYFWRGWHDFLFFISEDGAIVDHGWWFAYE